MSRARGSRRGRVHRMGVRMEQMTRLGESLKMEFTQDGMIGGGEGDS